jgi:hypothetical protein
MANEAEYTGITQGGAMGNQSDVSGGSQIIKKQLSYSEIEQISKAFVASGMFGRDVDKISKGITKIMAGQELGLAPFASMRAVHVIEGNATLSANTMAGMIKSSGRYDYTVVKKEVDGCVIDFYEILKGKRTKIGTESFDKSEAQSAGLLNKQNWQKYPKAMMFARCISNGTRTYCPDVFSGMLVYTPDELNAQVNIAGDVIDIEPSTGEVTSPEKPAAPKSKKETEAVDADIDQTPHYENEGTDDHPDITDPNEPSQDEIEEAAGVPHDPSEQPGSVEVPAQEPEEEPEPVLEITDEVRETAWEMYESLPLKGQYKLRFLKDVTGVITKNSMKKDEQWRALYTRCEDILGGDVQLPAEYVKEGTQTEIAS